MTPVALDGAAVVGEGVTSGRVVAAGVGSGDTVASGSTVAADVLEYASSTVVSSGATVTLTTSPISKTCNERGGDERRA